MSAKISHKTTHCKEGDILTVILFRPSGLRYNIKKFRLKADITQEELAFRSGLSQGYINQLESGGRRFTQKTLEMIAEALSVAMIELFKEEYPVQTPVARDGIRGYGKRGVNRKEFLSLLNDLPENIVEHYFILMKLEMDLRKKSIAEGQVS